MTSTKKRAAIAATLGVVALGGLLAVDIAQRPDSAPTVITCDDADPDGTLSTDPAHAEVWEMRRAQEEEREAKGALLDEACSPGGYVI